MAVSKKFRTSVRSVDEVRSTLQHLQLLLDQIFQSLEELEARVKALEDE